MVDSTIIRAGLNKFEVGLLRRNEASAMNEKALLSHSELESTSGDDMGRKPPNTKRLVNDEGAYDHTALLPTKRKTAVDFENLNLKERDPKLKENAKRVLELVYRNIEEATSEPYRYEKTRVTLSYGGELFTAIGVRNLELGWKKNRPDETKECLLPKFKKKRLGMD